MTELFDCTDDEARARGISSATEVLSSRECIVLPTDTVYGIGADAFSAQAVAVLLAAKGRGRNFPPPVLISDARVWTAWLLKFRTLPELWQRHFGLAV